MLSKKFATFVGVIFVLACIIAGLYTFMSHPGDVKGDVKPLETSQPAANP
jgi:hypothetical protein